MTLKNKKDIAENGSNHRVRIKNIRMYRNFIRRKK